MKVGDYVRTIYGIKKVESIVCGQDVRFDNTDGFDDDLRRYHNYDGISFEGSTWREIVERTSPNIIDLIEVGDFVTYKNGNCYFNIPTRVSGLFDELTLSSVKMVGDNFLNEVEITSILTKEQFENRKYRIGK